MTARPPVEAGFVNGRRGRLFSVQVRPLGAARSAALFVHGWAEELTKARHMVSAAARALAQAGCVVQLVDLFGCGDSEGEFADADLETWLGDLGDLRASLASRFAVPVHLWGLRSGALLAARLAAGSEAGEGRLLLWQPPAQGRVVMNEFLRLRTAAGMLRGDEQRETVDTLRQRLVAGEAVEVAGFVPAGGLFEALDGLKLVDLVPTGWRSLWLEVAKDPQRPVSPALARAMEAWRGAGVHVEPVRVPGVPFWASGELQFCPALVAATAHALGGEPP